MFGSSVLHMDDTMENVLQLGESGENHAQQAANRSGSFRLLV